MRSLRVLITGSEGTLGVPLTAELESRGHEVYGCDLMHTERTKYVRADVRELDQVFRAFNAARPDVVIHNAAEFGRVNGEEFFPQLWSSNQIGTQNVIQACLDFDSRFVLAGSSEAYGENDEPWLKESYLDSHAPHFHNQYALSKWAQEQQTFIAAKNSGLKVVVLRYFNSFGPGEFYSPYRSVVCLFCYRLLHGQPITVYKNYHRVFMAITDWARTVANVAERFDNLPLRNCANPVPIYNIGGREYRSVEELANIILKQLGNSKELRSLVKFLDKEAANVTNKRPDISLAERDLDHNPTVTLEDGVADTLAWMQKVYGV